jgi:thiol-disulfide isomerase/thioredoxin
MRWLWFGLVMMLAACGAAGGEAPPLPEQGTEDEAIAPASQAAAAVELPDMGQAPPIEGEVWLNVDEPLVWQDLRGQVVLVEMWTFGCINCRHVIPHLREWHARYADQGLVVIGNHYPEFSFEKDLGNLKAAVQELEIAYPVVQDNQRLNWGRYENRYWPTLYLVDKAGQLRYQHIGEGAYELTEQAIQVLLDESPG